MGHRPKGDLKGALLKRMASVGAGVEAPKSRIRSDCQRWKEIVNGQGLMILSSSDMSYRMDGRVPIGSDVSALSPQPVAWQHVRWFRSCGLVGGYMSWTWTLISLMLT